MKGTGLSRRHFLGAAATAGAFAIVPRHVLGGEKKPPPSDTATYATIGNGSRRDAGIGCLGARKKIAVCDVDYEHMAKEKPEVARYKDFRLLVERKDLDCVAIGTPPHWHALPCIAAAQAGKHVFCEKPMTKFIAEGRAVADAVARYGVAFQIGTFGRFKNSKNPSHRENHKIIRHGLAKDLSGIVVTAGARNRIGKTNLKPEPVPANLDYDFWLGPAPWKPYNKQRVHYNNRFYWDYEGGDLTNFGYHSYDPIQWTYAKDGTAPVKARPHAPWPQHPDAVCHYGWVELTYADGLRVVITGGGWPKRKPYDGPKGKGLVNASDLDEAGVKKLRDLPAPEPLVNFGTAVRTGKRAGGHAESSHRVCTALHLANIAIRVGRTVHYDPVAEQIVGDDEAARFVNPPMRPPWHL